MGLKRWKWFAVILSLLLSRTVYIIISLPLSMQYQSLLDKNNELIFDNDDESIMTSGSGSSNGSGNNSGSYPRDDHHSSLMQSSRGNEQGILRSQDTSFYTVMQENRQEDTSKFDEETAILITSNWIPSAPKIDIIQEVIDSLSQLKGLSPRAPVFIIVDYLFPNSDPDIRHHLDSKEREKREHTLEEYSFNLMREYRNKPNFHIIVNKVNLHIGGNLNKTLHILDDDTKFLYFVQHDFKFVKEINHTAIVKAMKDYPHRLKNVRFNKKTNVSKRRGDLCWSEPDAELRVEGANFTKTSGWSDNNHFASVKHYKSMIKEVVSVNRPFEAPMQHKMYAHNNCSKWAQHVYGGPSQGRHILHLDGRLGIRADKVRVANMTKDPNITS